MILILTVSGTKVNKETKAQIELKKRGLPPIHLEIPADIEKSKEKEQK